jgi:hypothetical protein
LIHEAKLQLLDKFQESVECLNYEGLGWLKLRGNGFQNFFRNS